MVPFKNCIRTKILSQSLILDSPLGLCNLQSRQHTPTKVTSEECPETSVKIECKVHLLLQERVSQQGHTPASHQTLVTCLFSTAIKCYTALLIDLGYSIKSKNGNVTEFEQQCDQTETCLDFISSNILEKIRMNSLLFYNLWVLFPPPQNQWHFKLTSKLL